MYGNDPSGKGPLGRDGSRGNLHGVAPGKGDRYPALELANIPIPPTGGDVEALVKTPSGDKAYPFIEDNGNGSIGVSYQPNERGLHTLDVTLDGDHVQGSPYKFHSSPLDDGKVHAYGPGLVHGLCGDPANFLISTRGAGAGDLALAVKGPSKAEIKSQDNKDGTVNVSYLPTAPGEYKISAKFAGEHIDGSPYTCHVTGEGKKRNAISVGASSDVTLPDNLSEYDLRALSAYIISPSGNEEPCFLKKLPKGNTGISFTPKEVGEHLVSVKRNGQHINNSPFKINVSPNDVGDASKVKVSGEALNHGQTHVDNTFHVDTKNAGYGGLSLSVEGPSKAEINCNDHEDGALDVSYRPSEPGLYIINLKFADQHVPGSPFAVAVSGQGSERLKEKIKHVRDAVPVTEVGSQCRLTFKMPGISAADLEASVLAPSGKINKAAIAELDDGLYAVNFVPYEMGVHTVSVKYHNVDIPGSPFQFTVGPLQDGGAHRVYAGGSGLERGMQGQPSDFNVWTREAGQGSLAISVEGPSKAIVDFKDRKDGSCHVSYTVEEPGEYSVGIRFNDQHIPGSPYKIYIQPSADDAERVRMSNVADNPVKADAPQTMLLNMNGADGDVECRIVAPSGREDDCFITPLGHGEHSVRFVPKEEGVHHLHARFNGVHIPGSPFKIIVGTVGTNNNDPSTVGVFGRGIESGTTGDKSKFVIDTSSVGAGTLSITVDGPSKVDLSCNEVENGYEVSYTPMVPGKYYVTVKYNCKNVAGSPFSCYIGGDNLGGEHSTHGGGAGGRVRKSSRSSMTMETLQRTSYTRHQYTEQKTHSHSVSRSSTQPMIGQSSKTTTKTKEVVSDPTKVAIDGRGLLDARLNRNNSFSVDCSRAGNNILYVGVYGPDIPCDEVVIKHQGNKKYSVDYVVRERGKYIIFVKWGDDHVPGSPYHIEV
jgi:filamin